MFQTIVGFINEYQINLLFRMIVSGLCGIAIGFERTNRAKEAGIRTHCIVAIASALMMIISKYGFSDLINGIVYPDADVRLDPSRMAQGIVTGVGFLGAGMIYIQRGSIKGLTTAAGMWATSGIGMALGAGMYEIGISSTMLIIIAQLVLHTKNKYMESHKTKTLLIFDVNEEHFKERLSKLLSEKRIILGDMSIVKKEDMTMDYTVTIEIPDGADEEELVRSIDYRCSLEFAI